MTLEPVRVIAERVAGSYALEIFDVHLRREAGGQVLRIVIDRPGPAALPEDSVSVEDCARVSREIGTILDVEDVIGEPYTLEVSSPGLDRPLRHADDYRRFEGRLAKIVTRQPVDRQTAFAGRLRGVEGDAVVFEGEGGRVHRIPFTLIARGRLDVEF